MFVLWRLANDPCGKEEDDADHTVFNREKVSQLGRIVVFEFSVFYKILSLKTCVAINAAVSEQQEQQGF